jgi:hypothetical protein
VLATASQLARIASVSGVTRIYANKQLRYFMPEANAQIGADRVWQQLGVTGKGSGSRSSTVGSTRVTPISPSGRRRCRTSRSSRGRCGIHGHLRRGERLSVAELVAV